MEDDRKTYSLGSFPLPDSNDFSHEKGVCRSCRRSVLVGDDGRVMAHNMLGPLVRVDAYTWKPAGKCPGGGALPWKAEA